MNRVLPKAANRAGSENSAGSFVIAAVTASAQTPSPFAASLLFSYVANYIYDGDAPLAERRAQALSVDQSQLRELLGDAELRELLDPGVDQADGHEIEITLITTDQVNEHHDVEREPQHRRRGHQ